MPSAVSIPVCIPVGKRPIKKIDRQMLQLQENKHTLLKKDCARTTHPHKHAHVRTQSLRHFLKGKEKKQAKVKL